MKRFLVVPVCCSFLLGSSYAKEFDNEKNEDVPLIVSPPSSAGTNQGFSRSPKMPYFCKQKSILVYECVRPTKKKTKDGNNSVFEITEYYVHPEGKEFRRTTYRVFEGSSEIKNIDTEMMHYVSDYTFREELGDGAYCLYSVKFAPSGNLVSISVTCYNADHSTSNSYNLYSL